MYYVKHKGEKVFLDTYETFTNCQVCGKEEEVDIIELAHDFPEFSLYDSGHICDACREKHDYNTLIKLIDARRACLAGGADPEPERDESNTIPVKALRDHLEFLSDLYPRICNATDAAKLTDAILDTLEALADHSNNKQPEGRVDVRPIN